MRRASLGLALAGLLMSGAAHAISFEVCDRPREPSADERDVMLRFGAIVRDELATSRQQVVLIARSGLESKEIAPLIVSLLSIPCEKRYPEPDLAPTDRKEQTIAALLALFEGLAKEVPVLALLEDAHWIDPTSLDVFGQLVHRLPSRRALLAVTFRPEFAAPWVGRAHVASLTLSRFGRPEDRKSVM